MRKIGVIENPEQGRQLAEVFFNEGIIAHVDAEGSGGLSLWVEDEDRLAEAKSLLDAFLRDPDAPAYLEASQAAERKRKEVRQADAAFAGQVFNRRRIARRVLWMAIPVTRILIFLSVFATVFGGLGTGSVLTRWLSITEYAFVDGQVQNAGGVPEVVSGQVWRLITPIFLHASILAGGFGMLHILFNMIWLLDLGGMLERAQGGWSLLVKVLVFGVGSNLLQYFLVGPAFGGMSGVVFGLLGYCWVRGKLDLTSGLYVRSQIMLMMVFWFFLGFSGEVGPIANAAHGGGLAMGLLWGYLAAARVNVLHR
jgi:GlpG protein